MLPLLLRVPLAGRPALRVGFVLDSPDLPAWAAEAAGHAASATFVDVAFVGVRPAAGAPRRARGSLLYRLYARRDARSVDPSRDPLARADAAPVLGRVAAVDVGPAPGLTAGARRAIQDAGLDVLVDLTGRGLEDPAGLARHGVWAYRHGTTAPEGRAAPYFVEVRRRLPRSGVAIEARLDAAAAPIVLADAYFATQTDASQARNALGPYWGSTTLLLQALRAVHARGWDAVAGEARARTRAMESPVPADRTPAPGPGNLEMARWLGPLVLRKAANRLRRRPGRPRWKLAIRAGGASLLDTPGPPDMTGFRIVEPPPGRFHADPFLVRESGRTWVFFEDFDLQAGLGRLACRELAPDGAPGPVIPVLAEPWHLSYPCLVRCDGDLCLIPEAWTTGRVDLYRCRRFPDRWERDATLFEGPFVDSTVFARDGRWWCFTTVFEARGHGTQLWLFTADSLRGPWRPHPASPLSTDVRRARGAGAVFEHDGRLYRPSQDGSGAYGRAFTLNEVTRLDAGTYDEAARATVEPGWAPDLLGTHSYARLEALEVTDALVRPVASRSDR